MKITSYNLLIGVLVIVFHSCNISDKKTGIDYRGFSTKEIALVGYNKELDLKDTLGLILLEVPVRLDTFYKWYRRSDCLSCGRIQYRFADKKYPKFPESGFYWTGKPDSVYQLTIRHNPIKEAPDTITLKPLSEKNNNYWGYHLHLVSHTDFVTFLLKDFKLIKERPFAISAFITPHGYLTDSQTLFVIAETNLKSRELYFIGECGAKDTTGFIESMYKSFLSIRIKENP
jgi:hypothetical protein